MLWNRGQRLLVLGNPGHVTFGTLLLLQVPGSASSYGPRMEVRCCNQEDGISHRRTPAILFDDCLLELRWNVVPQGVIDQAGGRFDL
jgi:hypothetical protein